MLPTFRFEAISHRCRLDGAFGSTNLDPHGEKSVYVSVLDENYVVLTALTSLSKSPIGHLSIVR